MRPVASNDNLQEPSRPSHSYCVSQTLRGSTDPSLRVIMCAGHRKPFEDLPTRRFDPFGGSVLCVANPSRIYRPDASSYNVRRPSRTGCICCHPLCVHIPRAGCRRDLRALSNPIRCFTAQNLNYPLNLFCKPSRIKVWTGCSAKALLGMKYQPLLRAMPYNQNTI